MVATGANAGRASLPPIAVANLGTPTTVGTHHNWHAPSPPLIIPPDTDTRSVSARYAPQITPAEPEFGPGAQAALARIAAGYVQYADSFANGHIPAHALCALSWDSRTLLRCDGAFWLELAVEAGMPTAPIISGYRSFAMQTGAHADRPHLAAPAGQSEHGRGRAIDIQPSQINWINANPDFGWYQPAWARPGGARPEPWHFEFRWPEHSPLSEWLP